MQSQSEEAGHFKGACHCGAVQLVIQIDDQFNSIRRCNCSMCRMRGAVAVSVQLKNLEIVKGENRLSCYRFNTGVAQHYFCSICGIYTHHQRRSNPEEYGVNVACLEGVSPFDFTDVRVTNGAHHSRDRKPGEAVGDIVGRLRFESSKR